MEDPATRKKIGLVDWSLTETTLEEVFLKLAEMSHLAEKLSTKGERMAKPKSWVERAHDWIPVKWRMTRHNDDNKTVDDIKVAADV